MASCAPSRVARECSSATEPTGLLAAAGCWFLPCCGCMQPVGDGEQDCCQLATHAGNGVGVRTTDTARERGGGDTVSLARDSRACRRAPPGPQGQGPVALVHPTAFGPPRQHQAAGAQCSARAQRQLMRFSGRVALAMAMACMRGKVHEEWTDMAWRLAPWRATGTRETRLDRKGHACAAGHVATDQTKTAVSSSTLPRSGCVVCVVHSFECSWLCSAQLEMQLPALSMPCCS